MKITTTIVENNKYSQIFVEKDEMQQKKVKDKIELLKKQGHKIAIFVSGNDEILEIIKNIIYIFNNP